MVVQSNNLIDDGVDKTLDKLAKRQRTRMDGFFIYEIPQSLINDKQAQEHIRTRWQKAGWRVEFGRFTDDGVNHPMHALVPPGLKFSIVAAR
jgi:hypothetical protein